MNPNSPHPPEMYRADVLLTDARAYHFAMMGRARQSRWDEGLPGYLTEEEMGILAAYERRAMQAMRENLLRKPISPEN